jgi:glycine/D-amino acid oxidase-like deaminating enzyme
MNASEDRKALSLDTVRLCEDVPIVDEADLCVLGGSCTGVFAAVRAARMGLRVALVEKANHFGGVATAVCTWHSLLDTAFRTQIIAGLTQETIERLERRDGAKTLRDNAGKAFEFRPGELKLVLDELVVESGIRVHLHTLFTRPVVEDGKLSGVVIENKSGRGILRAKTFIDATGDGDLCARLGLREYRYDALLPPTTCAFLDQWSPEPGLSLGDEIRRHGERYGIEPGFVWGTVLPGTDVYMVAGTRVRGADCSNAEDLTRAEIEGRRQVRAMVDLLRAEHPELKARLLDFPTAIGVRDTRHIRCQYQLRGTDVLEGTRFSDAIANGSYRVDTHHQNKPGITFMYLDGRSEYLQPGLAPEKGRWRETRDVDPTFYQIPLRCLIPGGYGNLLLAGRMLDADKTAFSAARVMVNTNQTGEAAGVAAALCLAKGIAIDRIPAEDVRDELARGGSAVI